MARRKHLRGKSAAGAEIEERELKSGVIVAEHRAGQLLPREFEPTMQTAGVLLVAVERDATLPTWIAHCQDRVSDVFVLVGNAEEPADALLRRIEQRLALLAGSERQRGLVVLVAEPGCASPEAEQARMQVANRLIGYLAQLGEGMLLLLSQESAAIESRVQLLSMAGSLAQQVRGTRISINVRFGLESACEPPPEILGIAELPMRRTSRRPPSQSGQMPKPSLVPVLRKAASVLPKRRLSNVS